MSQSAKKSIYWEISYRPSILSLDVSVIIWNCAHRIHSEKIFRVYEFYMNSFFTPKNLDLLLTLTHNMESVALAVGLDTVFFPGWIVLECYPEVTRVS